VICEVRPRKLKPKRIGTLRIKRKMLPHAKQQPSYPRHAIFLAHSQDEGQRISQDLMSTTRLIPAAHTLDCRPEYPTIGDRLGGKLLTGRLGGHDHIARPIKCQNLAVPVFEKPDGADYAFDNLDLLRFLFPFPEECATARNKRCGKPSLFLFLHPCGSEKSLLRMAIVWKHRFVKHVRYLGHKSDGLQSKS
jgi:hypothetical protein